MYYGRRSLLCILSEWIENSFTDPKNSSQTNKQHTHYEKNTKNNWEEGKRGDAKSKRWQHRSQESVDPETRYSDILGVKGPISRDELKKRYREVIAKYHPDKVQHLGDEFQKMAEEKTKIIHEAYAYFKKKYNIKE
jgi:ABC-type Zn2+ transport system substrate-binding protein/surface adhesin